MRVVVGAMVKNEESKFLDIALRQWRTFADAIVVLDDKSTDETALIAQAAGAHTYSSTLADAWGSEAPVRELLWQKCLDHTEPGDYIFILDADMVPAKNPRKLLEASQPQAVAWVLYDLWSKTHYREDEFWQGHNYPRIWCVQHPANLEGLKFSQAGIHSGHFPTNLRMGKVSFAPKDYGILPYAYSTPALRIAKLAQYQQVWDQLSGLQQAHAWSIGDESPRLLPLDFAPALMLS